MVMPDRKVLAGGAGASLAVVVIWVLNTYFFDGAIAGEAYGIVAAFISLVAGYLVPSAEGEGDA